MFFGDPHHNHRRDLLLPISGCHGCGWRGRARVCSFGSRFLPLVARAAQELLLDSLAVSFGAESDDWKRRGKCLGRDGS